MNMASSHPYGAKSILSRLCVKYSRRLQRRSRHHKPFEPPLRILLVTARPDNAGFVDPRSIARELLDAVSEQVAEGTIALEFLRPPTLATLRKRLSNDKLPPIHILHFDGHGAFGEMNGANAGLTLEK